MDNFYPFNNNNNNMAGPSNYQHVQPQAQAIPQTRQSASVSPNISMSSSLPTREEGRVRFLKACDRCRKRKMKCDSENPCTKCRNAGAECTFDNKPGPSRVATSFQSSGQTGPSPDQSDSWRSEGKRRKSMTITPPSVHDAQAPRSHFGHTETAHFFTSKYGQLRYAGSTSGLPLLDVARQQSRAKEEPRSPEEKKEPDWLWLSSLLQPSSSRPGGGEPLPRADSEDLEYFPGGDLVAERTQTDVFALIAETIPPDLVLSLVNTYFDVVQPKWPIIHVPTFFTNFVKWDDYAYAALVVAMCMVASRYSSDPRVRSDPDNPSSAGTRFFPLFTRLRHQAVNYDNVVYAVQAQFLAAQFHCVDNVPHPIATSIMAEAVARCLDAGLHRETSYFADEDLIHKQTRTRTAWACYIWDKHIAAICGRPPLLRIYDWEVSLPVPFEHNPPSHLSDPTNSGPSSSVPSPASRSEEDERHVKVFAQMAVLSVVLEKVTYACNHYSVFYNSDLLTRMSKSSWTDVTDDRALEEVRGFLAEWRRGLPMELIDRTLKGRLGSPMYSAASEQVAAMEMTVELLLAGRKMQLAMLEPTSTPGLMGLDEVQMSNLHAARAGVLSSSRDLVSLVVNLGAKGFLNQVDIVTAYLLLLAGRMILAVLLSARGDGHQRQKVDAESAVQAVAVLLGHLANTLPISLGASEVFNETCRVCRVVLPSAKNQQPHRPRYAWYRPIGYHKRPPTSTPLHPTFPSNPFSEFTSQLPTLFDPDLSPVQPIQIPPVNAGSNLIDPMSLFMDLQAMDTTYEAVNMANQGVSGFMPFSGGNQQGGTASEADLTWLLLGGNGQSTGGFQQ